MTHRPAAPEIPSALRAWSSEDELIDDALLRNVHVGEVDLAGRSARLVDIEGCRLDQTSLRGVALEKLTLSDCVLDGCDLANARFAESSMHRAVVRRTRLTGWDITGGILRHVRFEDCPAAMVSLRFAKLDRVELVGCTLTQADFTHADLRGASFIGCNLTGAQLFRADLRGARLWRCTLDQVSGVDSLAGATIAPADLPALAYALADALDITIEEEEPDG